MLDSDLNCYLIEVNTNPALDCSCLLLQRLLPYMLDQAMKIAVDPFVGATPAQYGAASGCEVSISDVRYEMIYETPLQQ